MIRSWERRRSSIPDDVTEKPVDRNEEGKFPVYKVVDCFLRSNLVGQRVYNHQGILVSETPLKDGLKHGREITWDDSGRLLLIEPYANGMMHGTAKQYGHNGKVIGAYKMVHGTGFDIWRQESEDNEVFVSEIHSLKDGLPNGYEWWFASSERDLFHERHWKMGKLHGIERMWNHKGKLKRGYPAFFVSDRTISRQKYIKLTSKDKTLPTYREKDNLPYRILPSDVMIFISSPQSAS